MDNLSVLPVVKLDLHSIVDCLNQAYKSCDLDSLYLYACCVLSYVDGLRLHNDG